MARATYEHVEIEPAASDFIELLRELGHLDDVGIESLTSDLMRAGSSGKPVTLADVRRQAAIQLFELREQMRPDQRELLDAEWGRLFA